MTKIKSLLMLIFIFSPYFILLSEDFNTINSINNDKLRNMIKEKINIEKIGIHSILIIQKKGIVFEEYFNDYNNKSLHITYHIINSIISCLIGICIDEGLIKNVDQKIISFFPEYKSKIIDQRQLKISIKHLLTMTGGYNWSSEHNDEPIKEFVENKDLLEYMFSSKLVHEPGTKYNQNSGGILILTKIIEKVSSSAIAEIAYKKLFSPLGIIDYKWEIDYIGKTKGPYSLYLKSIDLAKIGYLIMNYGIWSNKQVISKNWIIESTKLQFKLTPIYPIFVELEEKGIGYLWWVYSEMIAASGHAGQNIFILNDKKIVIVITAASPFYVPAQLYNDIIKYFI